MCKKCPGGDSGLELDQMAENSTKGFMDLDEVLEENNIDMSVDIQHPLVEESRTLHPSQSLMGNLIFIPPPLYNSLNELELEFFNKL